jgi:hypothetical protein
MSKKIPVARHLKKCLFCGACMNSKRHPESLGKYGNNVVAFSASGFVSSQSVRRCPGFRWGERPREPRCPGFDNDCPGTQNRRPVFKSRRPESKTFRPDFVNSYPDFASRRPGFQNSCPGLVNRCPGFFQLCPEFQPLAPFLNVVAPIYGKPRQFCNLLPQSILHELPQKNSKNAKKSAFVFFAFLRGQFPTLNSQLSTIN